MSSNVREMSVDRLRDVLFSVRTLCGLEFSGIGVIVYESLDALPVFPLRSPSIPATLTSNLITDLSAIARLQSPFHDGFHLVSVDGELTHAAQYFSPPIERGVSIDRSRQFGGRYLAALFGSAIPGIRLTGVASNGFGLAIFEKAQEVHFEEFT